MILRVELFTRKGCHLCDDAKVIIDRVRADLPFELAVFDIDEDPALRKLYDWEVPVIVVGGRKHAKFRLDERAFRHRVAGAGEGDSP